MGDDSNYHPTVLSFSKDCQRHQVFHEGTGGLTHKHMAIWGQRPFDPLRRTVPRVKTPCLGFKKTYFFGGGLRSIFPTPKKVALKLVYMMYLRVI